MEPNPVTVSTRRTAGIAGFWRRLLAFVLDTLILGAPAFLLGLFLFDFFAGLGGWGRVVGFVIAVLYFGILNSSLGGGQTVGKRVAAIRVVDEGDQTVGLIRSFGRSAFLCLPYFLNGALHDPALIFSWMGTATGVVIFGAGLSIVYLLVFNRRNRRGLHDLLAGTYVVKTTRDPAIPKPAIWPGHFVIVGLLLVGSLVVPIVLVPLGEKEPFRSIVILQAALMNDPEVRAASVTSGKSFFTDASGSGSATICNVSVVTARRVPDDAAFANRMAEIVFQRYPAAVGMDRLAVVIVYGYDLGIASGSVSQSYAFTPTEWKRRIQAPALAGH